MNIVSQNHTLGEHLSSKVSCFLEEFHVGKILKACNAYKVRGFSVSNVFQVTFENVFHIKSFYEPKKQKGVSPMKIYQQKKMNSSLIPFAKDTFYRLMNSNCINWCKFTAFQPKEYRLTSEPMSYMASHTSAGFPSKPKSPARLPQPDLITTPA